ncbi:MLV-related proviral Env polyprotein-like [Crotalus tigris]|uniref:MLV-related proviral Env polyprotein-like n=1 Tax=Crotalus tigris TaxID=88082 RepID=UPI00192F6B4A|nr:MLV-related proviral Env polyprotein-like [Crotalus tigris]
MVTPPPIGFSPECWNGILPHPCQFPLVFDRIVKEAFLTRQPVNPEACQYAGYILRKGICVRAPYKKPHPPVTLECGPPLFWGWEQVTLVSQLKMGWKGTCIVCVIPVEFGVTIQKPRRKWPERKRSKRSNQNKDMPHPLESRMQYNLWVQLAKIANTTQCLSEAYDMENLLSTYLVPVCVPVTVAREFGHYVFKGHIGYERLYSWGHVSKFFPPDALALHTPNVAVRENLPCAHITGCEQSTPLPHCMKVSQEKLNCTSFQSVSFGYANIWLPRGWFFTCGKDTFNYIPANLSTTYCCLSRLTTFLPDRSLFTSFNVTRYKRGEVLDEDCDSSHTLLNAAEYNALAISLVGVPALAVRAHVNIKSVTCNLAKTINTTSIALSAINQEMVELRKAILQNRAAIDYLLLRQHMGCEAFEGMCCFNLSDQSPVINKQIKVLHKMALDLKIDSLGSWWSNLWSWLPMGLIGTIIKAVVIFTAIMISSCCLMQCAFSLMNNITLPKRMSILAERKATAQVMAMWEYRNQEYNNIQTADPSITESIIG